MKLTSPTQGFITNKGSYSLYLLTIILLLLFSSFCFSAEREDYDLDNNRLIEINDLADLNEIRNYIDNPSLYGSDAGCPALGCNGFELTTDLDFDTNANGVIDEGDDYWNFGYGWHPIHSFSAIFDGRGHSISNFYINTPGSSNIGLFSSVRNAKIANVRFLGPLTFIKGHENVGVVVGYIRSSELNNIHVTAEVVADRYAGGLAGAGLGENNIIKSSTRGKINATSIAGGLIGFLESSQLSNTVAQSYSTSDITIEESFAGGLVGKVDGRSKMLHVFSTGIITGDSNIGGIVGATKGTILEALDGKKINYPSEIYNAFFTGELSKVNQYFGEYIGSIAGRITNPTSISNTLIHAYRKDSSYGFIVGNQLSDPLWDNYSALSSIWRVTSNNATNLKCATQANTDIDNSNCLPNFKENGDINDLVLYRDWDRYYHSVADNNWNALWDFGDDQQLPGFNFDGIIYRDSDGDGYLDQDDAFPLLFAASIDSDQDGYPNAWNDRCSLKCQNESGLIFDQFPDAKAAWLDSDFDGKPDAWADACDIGCQSMAIANGLELDLHLNDYDNDGLTADADTDENGDGIIDRDSDHDGLIEIYNLAELDAVRNNTKGEGYVAELGGEIDTSGCPTHFRNGQYVQACSGYELKSNLDFDTNNDGVQDWEDDYDNGGRGWNPLPLGSFNSNIIFEGNNHTVKGLHINRYRENFIGLFSEVIFAEIRNLNIVTEFEVQGSLDVGTLAGRAQDSTFRNINIKSSVRGVVGERNVGGLIGHLEYSELINCKADAIITSGNNVGGLVGNAGSHNIIVNSLSKSEVNGASNVGGLIGHVGWNNSIKSSYSVGSVAGSTYIGGLIGYSESNNFIYASYSTGEVTGNSHTGGLIGYVKHDNDINSTYATGSVQGGSKKGGLIGTIESNNIITASFAVGEVQSSLNSGGLIGFIQQDEYSFPNNINNSYWATDSTTQFTSAGSSNENNNIGLTLASLKCATSANEESIDNNCLFDNANELIDLPLGLTLYKDWELAGKINSEEVFEPYWDFGNQEQLPALVYEEFVRRDSDEDGVFDKNDIYPLISLAGREDMDGDGIPDICYTSCLAAGMVEDGDTDGDGVPNEYDAYPRISLGGLADTDNDGIPNTCDYFCEQLTMTADSDDDNDSVPDSVDKFPIHFEVAVDDDQDGLADSWTEACDIDCQNASEIVLDSYLNDADNDGLIDGEGFDTDLTTDNGLPHLISTPREANTKVDNDEGTLANYYFSVPVLNTVSATDAVDESLIYEVKFADQVILVDPVDSEIKHLILPSGRQAIHWTAIDDAGNRSNSLEQIVNVYPKARFSASYSEAEENSIAIINLELTASPPAYPVIFFVRADIMKSTAGSSDLPASAQIDLASPLLITLTENNEVQLNKQTSLNLPIAQDGLSEEREIIYLSLTSVQDEINGSNYYELMQNSLTHTLEITEENFDEDGDGVLDVDDAFPLNFAASVDTDRDGNPDDWNSSCGFDCYSESSLILDLDDDNDGVVDTEDLYPLITAVAIDGDSDGLPDQWTPNCNLTCQINSGFILDEYLNDSDNDGLINALDNQHGIDNGKPILTSIPDDISMSVNSADSLYAEVKIDALGLQEFEATDAVDDSLFLQPLWNGKELAYESGEFVVPIGRQIIQWVAVDDAGNRSEPMEQIINVYPEVKFTALQSVSGEGSTAQVEFKLTGPSPVYPVKVGLKLNFEDASANSLDIQPPKNDNNFFGKVHYFEILAGQGNTPNTEGVFGLPIASDGIDEDDERVFIDILTIENENSANNYFGIVEDHYQHSLTITDENLPPAIRLEILQRGIFVDAVDIEDGEVVIRIMVDDPNGEDRHTYEWDLVEFGLNLEITNTIRMDPSEWTLGEHELTITVSDNGNPVMTTELVTNLMVIKTEEQPAPEENGEGNQNNGNEYPIDQGNEGSTESGSSVDSSSGSGALCYTLFILLMLSCYQRRRRFH